MQNTLLSFGHGYSANVWGEQLLAQGWRVIGTTRSPEKAERLHKLGIEARLWNDDAAIAKDIAIATHILSSVAPDREGDRVLRKFNTLLSEQASNLKWVGYLSTTGVYGDKNGGWVDETSALTPSTARGQWRKSAESAWLSIPDLPIHIFRLAGIYGPGRGPFAKVRAGTARRIVKKDQVFSRIHVEDIAQSLQASVLNPKARAIYNLCDDDPAPPQDVIAYAAQLLGVPLPPEIPFETAEMTDMARSFYAESKCVSNQKIKDDLGVSLKYPNYRDGLCALLNIERSAQTNSD